MCCWRCCRSLALLPALLAFLCIGTFFITYAVSLIEKDVYPWFPTISQTADKVPERNIFSQLFNLCSFLLVVTLFVRYLQLKHDADWNEEARSLLLKLNKASLLFGLLAALGASLVANFQVHSIPWIHLTGAVMVFFFGIFYCWIQTLITFKMRNCGLNSACLLMVRSAFCVGATIFFLVIMVDRGISQEEWDADGHFNDTQPQWNPKDPGFVPHVVGDTAEWLMSLCIMLFIFTFFGEFKSIKMKLVVSRWNDVPVPLSVSDDSMRTPLLL